MQNSWQIEEQIVTIRTLFWNSANIIVMVSFIDQMKLYFFVLALVFLNHVLTANLQSIDVNITIKMPIKRNVGEKSKAGGNSCNRKCFDKYDLCKRASTSLESSVKCMERKLKCMKECADLKFSKFFKKLKWKNILNNAH